MQQTDPRMLQILDCMGPLKRGLNKALWDVCLCALKGCAMEDPDPGMEILI